jgi:hypothetical protein
MLKLTAIPFLFAAALAVPPVAAQSNQQSSQTKPEQKEQAKPEAKDAAKSDPRTPIGPAQNANIRLELTITDQRGTATPISKTVTMVIADRNNGRIRTSGDVRTPAGYRPVTLNVDGSATMLRDSRVHVVVTLEFRPTISEGASEESTTPSISESISVILDDGKPLVVSQSADPHTDRKVRVELKATILK